MQMLKRWPVSSPLPSEPRVLTVAEVLTEFEQLLGDRHDMGLRNLIGDAILEPRNPFQKSRRNPKRWVVAGLGLCLLAALITSYFHLR